MTTETKIGTTVHVTPAYGIRPTGTYGIRGYRAHCEACGYLGNVVSYSGAASQRQLHVCEAA